MNDHRQSNEEIDEVFTGEKIRCISSKYGMEKKTDSHQTLFGDGNQGKFLRGNHRLRQMVATRLLGLIPLYTPTPAFDCLKSRLASSGSILCSVT